MDPRIAEKTSVPASSGQPSGEGVGAAQQEKGKALTLQPITSGFDPACVRCATESRLHDLIWKDENLLDRIRSLTQEREDSRIQMRLGLMTDGYRVDEAITPRLFRLGVMLTKILRLAIPMDLFIRSSEQMNAFCLPSRKGNRLVMCLHSSLVASLSSQELLFVMGHEVGHTLLKHGETLGISFDNPHFSPIEVVRLRALDRAQEVSCDRLGLLACQDVRVASTTLFKIASGLTEKWISFDEMAYARHFDELSSMAEVVDLEDASRTHPFDPLRVKALIAFSKSDTYAKAFGKSGSTIPAVELEKGVEAMLSVLDPDLSELESAKEEQAANQFLFNGALMVIAADGVVDPDEVAWLKAQTKQDWSGEELAQQMSRPEFQEHMSQELKSSARVLRNKLSEVKRAHLLQVMCDIALCGGALPDTELEALNHLRQLLEIRPEIAESALQYAKKDREEADTADDGAGKQTTVGRISGDASSLDTLDAILEQSKLPEGQLAEAKKACEQIRSQGAPDAVAARALVLWAINASRKKGPLTEAQGKRIAVSAIKVCRTRQGEAGGVRKGRATPLDKQVQEFGVVAMFQRGEKVFRGAEKRPCVVVSISRTKGTLLVAPEDNLDAAEEADPHELTKDLINGDWPPELATA